MQLAPVFDFDDGDNGVSIVVSIQTAGCPLANDAAVAVLDSAIARYEEYERMQSMQACRTGRTVLRLFDRPLSHERKCTDYRDWTVCCLIGIMIWSYPERDQH